MSLRAVERLAEQWGDDGAHGSALREALDEMEHKPTTGRLREYACLKVQVEQLGVSATARFQMADRRMSSARFVGGYRQAIADVLALLEGEKREAHHERLDS